MGEALCEGLRSFEEDAPVLFVHNPVCLLCRGGVDCQGLVDWNVAEGHTVGVRNLPNLSLCALIPWQALWYHWIVQ